MPTSLNLHALRSLLIAMLLGLIPAVALLHADLPVAHDSQHHLFRTVAIADGWNSGYTIPRWSSSLGGGYGYPVFIYAAWLPALIPGLLYLSGMGAVLATNLGLVIACMVLTTGSYLLGRELGGRGAGWAFLGLYAFAPYQLVNLYVRYAAAEFWGGAIAPWILLGFLVSVRTGSIGYACLASLPVAALILSHGISTINFIPLCMLLALIVPGLANRFSPKRLLPGLSLLLGFGITAFFWIPLVLLRNEATLSAIYSGRFVYGNHFLYPHQLFSPAWGFGRSLPGPDDGMSFQIGLVPLAVTAGILFMLVSRSRWLTADRKMIGFLLALAGLTIFCTTYLASWIWGAVPPLRLVHLPWRLLLPGVFLLATAAALVLARLNLQDRQRRNLGRGIAAAGLLFLIPYIGTKERKDYPDPAIRHRLATTYETTTGMDEYRPVGADLSLTSPTLTARAFLLDGVAVDDVKPPAPADSGKFTFYLHTTGPATLTLPLFMYPGWRVLVDGNEVPIGSSETGLINAPIKKQGLHTIRVERTRLPAQRVSLLISLFSTIVLTGAGAWLVIQRLRRQPERSGKTGHETAPPLG